MNFFDHIKKSHPVTGISFWMLSELLDDLGVRKMHRDELPKEIKARCHAFEVDPRKLHDDGMGDWIVPPKLLVVVLDSLSPRHGNINRIIEAKVAFGLMEPRTPTPQPALRVVENFEESEGRTLSTVQPPTLSLQTVAQPAPNGMPSVFSYGEREVRTVIRDGEPWFVAKDVCTVLEIKQSSRAIERLDEDEKGVISIHTPGGQQELNIVNEPGLYSLILGSRKPEAKAFKRWITHEVIPSIRKTGSYSVAPAPALPTDYKSALVALLEEVNKNEKQSAVILEMTPKAEFHDKVTDAYNCHTLQEAAQILGTGRNRLITFCYENSFLIRRPRKSPLPYQRYKDANYFQVIENPYTTPEGVSKVDYQTLVTGKGLVWLRKKWDEQSQEAA